MANKKVKDWRELENRTVSNYAMDHYIHGPLGLCSLCGNTGVIDTRQTAVSPAGYNAGRLNWCICPNGQAMRITSGKDVPGE